MIEINAAAKPKNPPVPPTPVADAAVLVLQEGHYYKTKGGSYTSALVKVPNKFVLDGPAFSAIILGIGQLSYSLNGILVGTDGVIVWPYGVSNSAYNLVEEVDADGNPIKSPAEILWEKYSAGAQVMYSSKTKEVWHLYPKGYPQASFMQHCKDYNMKVVGELPPAAGVVPTAKDNGTFGDFWKKYNTPGVKAEYFNKVYKKWLPYEAGRPKTIVLKHFESYALRIVQ